MSSELACSDRDQLRRLLLGKLSEQESAVVSEHLAQCASCQGITESLAASDPLIDMMREAACQSTPVLAPEVERVIAHLRDRCAAETATGWQSNMSPVCDPDLQPAAIQLFNEVTRELSSAWRAPQAVDEIGRMGTYRILRMLGSGGMGAVFLAEDTSLRRRVALKMMRPRAASSPGATERFLREARAAAGLRHDHIITVYQVGEEAGVPFLAMEYLEGESLDDRLRRQSPLPMADALRIGREIAEALAAAHAKGLLHRDVKPANVWLEERAEGQEEAQGQELRAEGEEKEQSASHDSFVSLSPEPSAQGHTRVKLLDFGLARSVEEDTQLTSTGMILGTPSYMAPEQANGESVDGRADLFALGVILYRVTTGQLPFPGRKPMEILKSLATLTPAAPRSLKPDIPKDLSDLIERLLAKAAKDRPKSAMQVARQLTQIEHALWRIDTPVRPVLSDGRSAHPPWRVAGLGSMALLAVVIVSIATRNGNQKDVAVTNAGEVDPVTTEIKSEDATGKLSVPELSAATRPVDSSALKLPPITLAKKRLAYLTPGFNQWAQETAALSAEDQVKAVIRELRRLNPGFDGKETHVIEADVVTEFHFITDHVTDISPVRAFKGLKVLTCAGKQGKGGVGKLADLSPLSTMSMLRVLNCRGNLLSDLSPIAHLPVLDLDIAISHVVDLSAIKGMPLIHLNLDGTNVTDISPLRQMPLKALRICFSDVMDLTPLAGLPLETLSLHFNPDWDTTILRSITSLKTIEAAEVTPLTDFCKSIDAYKARTRLPLAFTHPDFENWVKQTVAMPVEEQVKAVAAKLQQLNPEFNGQLTPRITNGVVTGLEFVTDHVTDISPVRAFKGLTSLRCSGTPWKDSEWGLSDISPLAGMSLESLSIDYSHVSDLSPVRQMKLRELRCQLTRVADLTPLQGLPLQMLHSSLTPVSDVSPLKGCPLSDLDLGGTYVRDLSPLKNMPLTNLCIGDTDVDDLSPLKELQLKYLWVDPRPPGDIALLRSIKTLETINGSSAADFWKEIDRDYAVEEAEVSLPADTKLSPATIAILQTADWPSGPGDEQFPGLVPFPTVIPGVHRWQLASRFPRAMIENVAVVWSPDGKQVACCGLDELIRVYDVNRLQLLRAWPVQKVRTLDWSRDGKLIASGCQDGRLHVWNAEDGTLRWSFKLDNPAWAAIWSVAFSPNSRQIATASSGHAGIRLWDSASGQPGQFLPHPRSCADVAWSPDGTKLATGCDVGLVRIWNPSSGAVEQELPRHDSTVVSLAFSSDGKQLVSTAAFQNEQKIRVWNLEQNREERSWEGGGRSIAVSPLGQVAAVGPYSGEISLWELTTGDLGLKCVGHDFHFQHGHSIRFSPDGLLLASINEDGSLKIWNSKTGESRGGVAAHSFQNYQVEFDAQGQTLGAAGMLIDAARLWNVADGSIRLTLKPPGCPSIRSIAFSPDGRQIVTCGGSLPYRNSEDQMLRIWNVKDGTTGPVLAGRADNAETVAYSPNGQQIVSSGSDGNVRVWNCATGASEQTFEFGGWPSKLIFNRDGSRLAALAWPDRLRIWNTKTGAFGPSPRFEGWNAFESLAFHPNSKEIATAEFTNARIRDVETGDVVRNILSARTTSVAINPDGGLLAVADYEWVVRLFHYDGGTQIRELRGHYGQIKGLAFSPDSRLIASSSADCTIRLWDVQTGLPLRVTLPFLGDRCVTISPAGRMQLNAVAEEEMIYLVQEHEKDPVKILTPREFQTRFGPSLPDLKEADRLRAERAR